MLEIDKSVGISRGEYCCGEVSWSVVLERINGRRMLRWSTWGGWGRGSSPGQGGAFFSIRIVVILLLTPDRYTKSPIQTSKCA